MYDFLLVWGVRADWWNRIEQEAVLMSNIGFGAARCCGVGDRTEKGRG